MDKICLQCGNEYHVPKSREDSKYCSNKCRFGSQLTDKNIQRKRETRSCKECDNNFTVIKSVKSVFCSRKCYWSFRNNNPDIKIQSNQGDDRIEKICENCKKKYKAHKYRTNSRFCSVSCYDDFRRTSLICPSCNKPFIIPSFKKERKYCSEECSAKGVLKRKSKFNNDVYSFLEKLYNIEDEKFIKVKNGKYFGDILLKEFDIIIECNGDYWHCNPNIYNENYFHKKIRKTAKEIWEKDLIKRKIITKSGYIVIVIWEYDWNNNDDFFNTLKLNIENEIRKNKKN